jgi:hypothetical protein
MTPWMANWQWRKWEFCSVVVESAVGKAMSGLDGRTGQIELHGRKLILASLTSEDPGGLLLRADGVQSAACLGRGSGQRLIRFRHKELPTAELWKGRY